MKTLFNKNLIKQSIGISWWKRIILYFIKPTYGYDFGNGEDQNCTIVIKRLFGKIYIVDEWFSKKEANL